MGSFAGRLGSIAQVSTAVTVFRWWCLDLLWFTGVAPFGIDRFFNYSVHSPLCSIKYLIVVFLWSAVTQNCTYNFCKGIGKTLTSWYMVVSTELYVVSCSWNSLFVIYPSSPDYWNPVFHPLLCYIIPVHTDVLQSYKWNMFHPSSSYLYRLFAYITILFMCSVWEHNFASCMNLICGIFILFIPCTVNWFTNSVSTNKCTVLYIIYFTINLLLHILAQFPSSGCLHQCC